MKDGYDFPKGEYGKLYRPDDGLEVPIYLDSNDPLPLSNRFSHSYEKKEI